MDSAPRVGSNGATPHAALGVEEGYPPPLREEALHGLAGTIVRELAPHTEADPVALLLTVLAAVGNIIGPGPHWTASGATHSLRLWPVLVGATSKARKGTSWATAGTVLRAAAPVWYERNTTNGLASGEGLIYHVRDPIEQSEPIRAKDKTVLGYRQVIEDPGVEDKRLMIVEEEFASVLKVAMREGNTLSQILRKAWDGGPLRSLVKNSPNRATGAHITVLGHITREELARGLDGTEAFNGFANRFLWACVRRSQVLPDGGALEVGTVIGLGDQLRAVIEAGRECGLLTRDADARALWHVVYGPLSAGSHGTAGAIGGRAEAQVMRLAGLYALLDECRRIGTAHLRAALAVWQYAEDSIRAIFGDLTGDDDADTVLAALRAGPLSDTEVSQLFGGHKSKPQLDRLKLFLHNSGRVATEYRAPEGRGRGSTIWRLV